MNRKVRKDGKKRLALIFFSIFIVLISGVSADNSPKPVVWYEIDVQLKLDEKQSPVFLDGRERLTWLNDSPDTIDNLQFHLYLNAFKNEKSTFFREQFEQSSDDTLKEGEWGWIDIREMRTDAGLDLTSGIEFIQPDDENADDQTAIRVPLSRPVGPGEKITLDIKFTAKLPRVFARTGYRGKFAMVAQWFPKLGVWESAGERRRSTPGWNCHQFHANSEFYSDFGVYDVKITVPDIYKGKVGATGVLRSEKINRNGTLTYNFYQENVHDFAWTADPKYLVVKRTLNNIDVTLLIQPEHQDQIDRHFVAAFNAIRYFGLWYGTYPYKTLTIVDPPHNAGEAGGMEYPTLITAGTSWRAGRDQNPEQVIIHEFGHQYWYGLVASNEFEEAWLDEGLNTYSTAKVLKLAYGPDVLPVRIAGIRWFYLPIEIEHPFEDRIMTLRGGFHDPITTPSWMFYDSMSYGFNSYSRPGLVINTLDRYLGEAVMARVMREYYNRWRYRHPTSEDFFDTVNEVSGRDMNWFFDQFVKGTVTLDYEITEATSTGIATAGGVFDERGRKTEVSTENMPDTGGAYETVVTITRNGEAWFPVELLMRFQDRTTISAKPVQVSDGVIEYRFNDSRTGRQWNESWDVNDKWERLVFTTPSPIQSAQLDPDRKVLLDSNLTNNSRSNSSAIGAGVRWSSGLMFWVQVLLQFFSALG